MRKFDYTFLRNMSVPTTFLSMTNFIYALKGVEEQKKSDYPEIFTRLREIAAIQSVKGSNAIEGIITTDRRIEDIVERRTAPLNHNEQEIAGYRDALSLIHEHFQTIKFDEIAILSLHGVMLSHTESGGGKLKTSDNIIRELYADGTSRVRFTPTSASETAAAMRELVIAYNEAKSDAGINQLLLVPCVILDFLCIHPFEDGNGRLSRLLSLLLLYQNGFDIPKYISFEEQINNYKNSYYEALHFSSVGWHENENDYIPFMENFIFTLYSCYKELDKRFLAVRTGKAKKSERIKETVLNAFMPISKSEICGLLIDVSPTTVEAVLGELVKSGEIEKIGSARNTKYFRSTKN